MTEPVYFKKEEALRVWEHGHEVCIAKDTGVYLITWNPDTPKAKCVDMACGYLEDGFYLNENLSPKDDMDLFSETWDASRHAVGGDDFCDPLPDPRDTLFEGATKLAIHVKPDEIEMWWVK
jgi:hypothetical protein